ncbi:MAG: VOC family protein [Terricaulis sp.]
MLHFGFKVHDIERTARAYSEWFGIDWDPIAEYALPSDGEPGKITRSKVTHGKTGDGVEIELVQNMSGNAVEEHVMGGREGVSHVAFLVDDLAVERARMEASGVAIVGEGSAPRASWVFVHDARLGGALVQLVQLNTPEAR